VVAFASSSYNKQQRGSGNIKSRQQDQSRLRLCFLQLDLGLTEWRSTQISDHLYPIPKYPNTTQDTADNSRHWYSRPSAVTALLVYPVIFSFGVQQNVPKLSFLSELFYSLIWSLQNEWLFLRSSARTLRNLEQFVTQFWLFHPHLNSCRTCVSFLCSYSTHLSSTSTTFLHRPKLKLGPCSYNFVPQTPSRSLLQFRAV
jgi:hypothetical protein